MITGSDAQTLAESHLKGFLCLNILLRRFDWSSFSPAFICSHKISIIPCRPVLWNDLVASARHNYTVNRVAPVQVCTNVHICAWTFSRHLLDLNSKPLWMFVWLHAAKKQINLTDYQQNVPTCWCLGHHFWLWNLTVSHGFLLSIFADITGIR